MTSRSAAMRSMAFHGSRQAFSLAGFFVDVTIALCVCLIAAPVATASAPTPTATAELPTDLAGMLN